MTTIINTKDLTKQYKETKALSNIRINIYEGEIYGFLGKNGAGKTTFMKLLLNLIKPTSGTIEIFGNPLLPESYHYLSEIGSIIEYPVFYEKQSAYDNMVLHCDYIGKGHENIDDTLGMVDMLYAKDQAVKDLSLGMKQRLGIARAIVTKPKLLILDEPINGLDPEGIRDIRLLLKRMNKEWNTTILISSHIVSEIESLADRIGILGNGQLLWESRVDEIPESNLENHFMNVIKGGK